MWLKFWARTLVELRKRGAKEWNKISPSKRSYLERTAEVSKCKYRLHIQKKKEVRVDLYLDRDRLENDEIFDHLEQQKQEIEERFDAKLKWPERQDDLKHRKIYYSKPLGEYNEENWPEMVEWLCEHIVRLEEAFAGPLAHLKQKLEARGAVLVDDP